MLVGAHSDTAGETESEVRRLRVLYGLLAALSRASALEEVYEAALTGLLEATAADRAAILLFDEDGVIRFKASRGLSGEYQAAVTGHSPWAPGARNAASLVVPDVFLEKSLEAFHQILQRESICSLVFVPLALDAGVFGKFMLYYRERHKCTPGELGVSEAIAAHVALATRNKRVELAHLRSEQRLQAILDNSSAVIFLKDVNGRYLLVNRRFEDVFHLDRTDVLGRTDQDLFSAALAAQFQANDRAVLDADKPFTLEEYAPHDDGIHTYLALKFPLKEPGGGLEGVCGIATDISDRMAAEAVSRKLAAIVESSQDAIIGKDVNGTITSWNGGAARIFGYTAAEVVGRPVAILAAPELSDEMPEILSKILRGERVEHYETRRRRKDGRVIDVALSISPVYDAAGRIIGAAKIARDITDQKLAEQERATLLAREQEARNTAELLNRVGPRLAAQLDSDKLVQEVTDIATALVGAEFGSFFHNVLTERGESYMLHTLSGVPLEALANLPMPQNTEVFGPIFRGEGVVRCADITQDSRYDRNVPFHGMPVGDLPIRSYLAAPVVARSGELLGGLFFGHSVANKFSENHEAILLGIAAQAAIAIDNARLFEQAQWAQSELKRSNAELRRANRDLEAFAYSASHDLQEPLRTIAISAQLIERNRKGQPHSEDETFLNNILTAARRMSTLVSDLLSYADATKYEEGQPPAVDSGRVLGGVVGNLGGLIQETGAVITAGSLPVIAIHETRLAQLFQNLIGNAVKYRGKEAPRIEISAAERDGWCVFSVTDNGIGIEPEYADRIFGLFKRLHGRDEYSGSGIGLAICQRVAEQYGGRIWLERSSPGQGSTFCFSLPLGS